MMPSPAALIFMALTVLFFVLSLYGGDGKTGPAMTLQRKIWLRLAFIFAVVSLGLYFMDSFLG
ncbi:MAG: hypothetical protein HY885_09075 [Deltaproteobacteria bacterium]|nr:hypothetical protein [Deltaproteobacteria bacterium]